MRPDSALQYRWTFALCALLSVGPLWAFDFLPMVDLPQHAAQVAIWRHWHDPAYGYPEMLTVNWWTPYLLAYFLAYLLSWLMPIKAAFTALVSVAILAVPLAVRLLLRETGGHPWWVFLCFPIGFSYSFYWGFVNYMLAVPLALGFILLAARFAGRPSPGRALGLALFAHLLFVAHAVVFGFCGLVAGLLVVLRAPDWRAALLRLVPLASALPLAAFWLAHLRDTEAMTRGPAVWDLGFDRVPELASLTLGMPWGNEATIAFVLLAVLPLLLEGRPARSAWRWAPLTVTLGLFFLAPMEFLGTSFLYPRLAVFLLPAWLFALDRSRAAAPRGSQLLAPAIAAAWLISIPFRLHGFQQEIGPFREVIAQIPPHQRVLYMGFDHASAHVPYYPVYLHFGCWYQVERGGMVDFSFVDFFPARFHYRPESRARLPKNFSWRPSMFDARKHRGELYDYFLARSMGPVAKPPGVLVAHRGDWWVYRRLSGRPAPPRSSR
jgi:hypothetical protein